MSWEAVGATGAIIGAMVLLATLVILSMKIRQNVKSIRSATEMLVIQLTSIWCGARGKTSTFKE